MVAEGDQLCEGELLADWSGAEVAGESCSAVSVSDGQCWLRLKAFVCAMQRPGCWASVKKVETSSLWIKVCWCLSYKSLILLDTVAYGHTTLKTPVLV